jgi:dihydroorotate dehydrogenase (NAD+) catalytic subunit
MLNAVGLANPGAEVVRRDVLPWLGRNLVRARVLVSVVGDSVEDFAAVIAKLDDSEAVAGYELNLSCPNVKGGGLEFGSDPTSLRAVVTLARSATRRPIFAKLSPAVAQLEGAAAAALESGADGLTLVNTVPGLLIDPNLRRPVLGFGSGGASGPGLLPIGVLAVARVFRATGAPIIGVGGVSSLGDALQYVLAGARAIAVGTAALRDPRLPERLVGELAQWCEQRGQEVRNLTGALEWRP